MKEESVDKKIEETNERQVEFEDSNFVNNETDHLMDLIAMPIP